MVSTVLQFVAGAGGSLARVRAAAGLREGDLLDPERLLEFERIPMILACAARELVEETGYAAGMLEKLAECYAMPGSSDEVIHVFAARGLVARPREPDPDEVIDEVRAFTVAELRGMLRQGEIRDAKTLVGLLHGLGRQPGGLRLG